MFCLPRSINKQASASFDPITKRKQIEELTGIELGDIQNSKMLSQISVLLWRFYISILRGEHVRYIRTVVWPCFTLLLLLGTFVSRKEVFFEDIDRQHFMSSIALTASFFSLVDYMAIDRNSGFKSLMITMGLTRTAYTISLFIIATIFIAPGLIISFFISIGPKEVTTFMVVSAQLVHSLKLVAMILVTGSLISTTSNSPTSLILILLDFFIFRFVSSFYYNSDDNYSLFILAGSTNSLAVLPRMKHGATAYPTTLTLFMAVWTILYWVLYLCVTIGESDYGKRLFGAKLTVHLKLVAQRFRRGKTLVALTSGLSKQFYRDSAVEDVCLEMFDDEITVLLGENGAGKTTLMRMIAGDITPTSGQVFVHSGRSIGYCPQHSVLDELLTVTEHLELFHKIKSPTASERERQDEVYRILTDLDLFKHRSKLPAELSGGMKRALSLALALIGRSEVLVLDEPSSGFDPELQGRSCMDMWDTIKMYRKSRAILMSTHNTKEAEYLHDKIVLLQTGQVLRAGTLKQLRKAFNLNYRLRVECDNVREQQVCNEVREHFAGCEIVRDAEQPGYSLINLALGPKPTRTYNDSLVLLITHLERRSASSPIRSYQLRCSTLEDVMLSARLSTKSCEFLLREALIEEKLEDIVRLNLKAEVQRSALAQPKLLFVLLRKYLWIFRSSLVGFSLTRLMMPLIDGAFINILEGFCFIVNHPTGDNVVMIVFRPLEGPLYEITEIICSLTMSHFVYFPSLEQGTGFKLQQLTGGPSLVTYWLHHFIPDTIYACIFATTSLLLRYVYTSLDLQTFKEDASGFFRWTVSSMLLSYQQVALLSYIISAYFCRSQTTLGYCAIIIFTYPIFKYFDCIMGGGCDITRKHSSLDSAAKIVRQAILPREKLEEDSVTEPNMYFESSKFLFYLGLLWIVENRRFTNPISYLMKFATKVKQAEKDVKAGDYDDLTNLPNLKATSLILSGLTKSYVKCQMAVNNLNLTVSRGECLTLVGATGAGKSTTLGLIVREFMPDSGSIWACGNYANSSIIQYWRKLTYKPQSNINIPLTPMQALLTLARLRGLSGQDSVDLVSSLLDVLGVNRHHANKRITHLSGGTRRKITLAMSLIGKLELLVLDEPTTGIDPFTRNKVWRLLRKMQQLGNCSILLSSHSLAECRTCCDRVAIMVDGEIKEVGSISELRSKSAFGCRFVISVDRDHSSAFSPSNTFRDIIRTLESEMSCVLKLPVRYERVTDYTASFRIAATEARRSDILRILVKFADMFEGLEFDFADENSEDNSIKNTVRKRSLLTT